MDNQESTNEIARQKNYTNLVIGITILVVLASFIFGVPLIISRFGFQKPTSSGIETNFPNYTFPEDAEIKSSSSSQDDGGLHFNVGLETQMTLEEVTEWYLGKLQSQGWILDEKASDLKSLHERNLVLTKGNKTLGIDLDEEEKTEVVVNLTISANN